MGVMDKYLVVQTIAIVAQALILLLAFGVAAWQVWLLRNQIKAATDQIYTQYEWQKRKATFDYLNIYITQFESLNRDLHDRISLLTQNGQEISKEAIQAELKDDNTRSKLFHLVSYWATI